VAPAGSSLRQLWTQASSLGAQGVALKQQRFTEQSRSFEQASYSLGQLLPLPPQITVQKKQLPTSHALLGPPLEVLVVLEAAVVVAAELLALEAPAPVVADVLGKPLVVPAEVLAALLAVGEPLALVLVPSGDAPDVTLAPPIPPIPPIPLALVVVPPAPPLPLRPPVIPFHWVPCAHARGSDAARARVAAVART